MRHIRLKLSVFFMLGLGLTGLRAQESINTSGGNASGSGGSAVYSVGQVVYQTYSGTTGTVAQGIQQPYEISLVSGIMESENITLSVSAYPNPTLSNLTLEINGNDVSDLSFQLFDISGKLLQNQKIRGHQTIISMSNCLPAIYFVKVIQNGKEIRTFKISKN